MKSLIHLVGLYCAGLAGCTSNTSSTATKLSAAERESATQCLRQMAGKSDTYTGLAWRRMSPLYQQEAGELAIQRLLKSWAANSYRVAGFNDTLFSLRPDTMARRLYGPDWQHVAFQAAREADNAQHRADNLGRHVSALLDSLHRADAGSAPSTRTGPPIAQRWQHIFQLTNKDGNTRRDTVEFFILPSHEVLLRFPLTERYWEKEAVNDPF
jgi:hypothetical protein